MTTVLIPHQTNANIYVRELGRAYQALGCKVIYGSENLLEGNLTPDLVHLQWPEEQYRWRGEGAIDVRINQFLSALAELKRRGARLAWTVHNINPHDHVDSARDDAVYQAVINQAGLIVHHCPASPKLLQERYHVPPEKPVVIVPHGNYLAYPNEVTRDEARRKLGIAPDAFVYLHFGAIRGYKGLDTLFAAFKKVTTPKKMLLVAGQYDAITGRGHLYDRLLMAWKKRTSRNLLLNPRQIPSEDIQLYFNASDCLVLSHSRGLNSGVAVLGMTFGKVVVGPQIGCIDWVLKAGKNLVYQAGSALALADAMNAAATVDLQECARTNQRVAENWQWRDVSETVLSTLGIDLPAPAMTHHLAPADDGSHYVRLQRKSNDRS